MVMAFADEATAFRTYAELFGDAVLILDTYDAVAAARMLAASGTEAEGGPHRQAATR
jgi:nicotinic acid phosphoribosyltransferase